MAETRTIQLTQGLVTVVDAEDYDFLSQWRWYANKRPHTFYAIRSTQTENGNRCVRMHSLILGTPKGLCSDHRNGNGLDNRRSNLRICTSEQNSRNKKMAKNNTTGCKGINWEANLNKWRVRIGIDGKRLFLGRYDDINEAIAVRLAKEKELYGEYRRII